MTSSGINHAPSFTILCKYIERERDNKKKRGQNGSFFMGDARILFVIRRFEFLLHLVLLFSVDRWTSFEFVQKIIISRFDSSLFRQNNRQNMCKFIWFTIQYRRKIMTFRLVDDHQMTLIYLMEELGKSNENERITNDWSWK